MAAKLNYLYLIEMFKNNLWPCRLGQQNTQTASWLRGKTHPASVLI